MGKAEAAGFGARALRVLRLALLWARKGGAFLDLRLALKPARRRSVHDRLRYGGEREFSFDETPAFRLKTPSTRWQLLLPRIIPCIAPPAADHRFDDDYDGGGLRFIGYDDAESSDREEEYDDHDHDHDHDGENDEQGVEEIDLRAEEFIARFYQEMKLQRQRSWIQYNEMLERSLC